jgi:hypothetical protein
MNIDEHAVPQNRNDARGRLTASEDLRLLSLARMKGALEKLAFIAARRKVDGYSHWGLEAVHGREATQQAFEVVHHELLSRALEMGIDAARRELRESPHRGALLLSLKESAACPANLRGVSATHWQWTVEMLSLLAELPVAV